MITNFRNEYRFLSNFWPLPNPIQYNGISYPTVEHFFQAMKTTVPKLRMEIASAPTPGQAKRLGRALMLRPNWEQVKIPAMKFGLTIKFSNNEMLKNQLLATGTEVLVEGNKWHDNIWGNCYCSKCTGIAGLNYLGYLLMGIRGLFQLIR